MVRRLFAVWPLLITLLLPVVAPSPAVATPQRRSRRAKPVKSPTKPALPANGPVTFGTLRQGQVVNGFRTVAVYTDARGAAIGGRFVHTYSGFLLDLVTIPSVPQAVITAYTAPTSDMGEPHTQEHLLLGKGSQGRSIANYEEMTLTTSNAGTYPLRTDYDFHTDAGPDTFFPLFEKRIDGLLHPNYSPEEVRREVAHYGVSEDPTTKALRLEEKGSVYNEMTGSFDQDGTNLWRAVDQAVFGVGHPRALVSGGVPEGIRRLTAADIKKFHTMHYRLGNMSAIVALPKSVTLPVTLAKLDASLRRQQPSGETPAAERTPERGPKLPKPLEKADRGVQVIPFPEQDAQKPVDIVFAYPAVRELDSRETLLLSLLLEGIAGDADTNLYKRLIDNKTRTLDTGASGVWAFASDDSGQPVYFGLEDARPEWATPVKTDQLRGIIMEEILKVVNLPDKSPECAAFRTRLLSRLVVRKRSLAKFVSAPPGFGFRWNGSNWHDQLTEIAKGGKFKRSLTQSDDIAYIEKLLNKKRNPFRAYLAKWRLTNVVPYALVSKASPELYAQRQKEKEDRLTAEATRLEQVYAVTDAQDALKRYQTDYNLASAQLEQEAKADTQPPFLSNPPMTPDDTLSYKQSKLPGDVPLVSSNFDSMTGAQVGLALKLNGIPESDLVYVALLPSLLTDTGVFVNGKALSYEASQERLRREILSLSAGFTTNVRTGRAELILRASGTNPTESKQATEWLQRFLTGPNWTRANLPRLQDVVDAELAALRDTRNGYDENWAPGVGAVYEHQDSPILLTTNSFLTRTHDALRLRWLLRGTQDPALMGAFLDQLATAPTVAPARADLNALLAVLQGRKDATVPESLTPLKTAFDGLPKRAQGLVKGVAQDLERTLPDVPDDGLTRDWSYLCLRIKADLLVSPNATLKRLQTVRRALLKAGGARAYVVGSAVSRGAIQPSLAHLTNTLSKTPFVPVPYSTTPRIAARWRERTGETGDTIPMFAGLVNPSSPGGVMLYSAPGISLTDTDEASAIRYLTFATYGGGGGHGLFMQTWGAGLAYSNGPSQSLLTGRRSYYADRNADASQTLTFVTTTLKKAEQGEVKPELTEYALAQAFSSRAGQAFESRAESIANDIADGVTFAEVKAFRQSVLNVRNKPDLAKTLHDGLLAEYAPIVPGLVSGALPTGASYLIIGPEGQFTRMETYLKSAVGQGTNLIRLYPRDFWRVEPIATNP